MRGTWTGGAAGAAIVALFLAACGRSGGSPGSGNGQLVALTTSAAADGTTGVAYEQRFEALFPHAPGVFYVTGGTLPPGLTLDGATGMLSGFPRQVGSFHFQIGARDGVDLALPKGRDASFAEDRRAYAVDVLRGPPRILPQTPPPAQYRASYGYQIEVAGGTPPYSFAMTGGTLPAGLSVDANGFVSAFPTQALFHPYTFQVTLTDSAGLTDTASLSVDVVVLPLLILTSALPESAIGAPYQQTLLLAATGGGAPFAWSQVAPTAGESLLSSFGMELTADGVLQPISPNPGPTVLSPAGGFKFTVQVTDEALQVATRSLSLVVNVGPVLTSVSPPNNLGSGPWVATGLNLQAGAQLIFKPGPNETAVPTNFVSSTQIGFTAAPPTPLGGGLVTVRVKNPDGGFYDLPKAFTFKLNSLAFGSKGFLSSSLSSMGLAVGDLNGDGRADIVHCGAAGFVINSVAGVASSTGGLEVFFNDGNLSLSQASLDAGNYYDVEIADVNLDGKPDIVALGQTAIRVWLNNPLGTFTPGPISPHASGSYPQDLSVGLVNADLIPDVVFGSSTVGVIQGSVFSMIGNGTGAFTQVDAATKTLVTSNGGLDSYTHGVVSLALVDYDGDGRQDTVAGSGFNEDAKSSGSGPFFRRASAQSSGAFGTWFPAPNVSPTFADVTAVLAGNFFGDGRPAVVVNVSQDPADGNQKQLAVFSGVNLATQGSLTAPSSLGKCLGGGDLDFDGRTDFCLTTGNSGINVYRGSSLSLATTMDAALGTPTVTAPRTGRVAIGDLDGDGKNDVVATTSYWACDYQANLYGTTWLLGLSGDGGNKGIVFFLNTSPN